MQFFEKDIFIFLIYEFYPRLILKQSNMASFNYCQFQKKVRSFPYFKHQTSNFSAHCSKQINKFSYFLALLVPLKFLNTIYQKQIYLHALGQHCVQLQIFYKKKIISRQHESVPNSLRFYLITIIKNSISFTWNISIIAFRT